ncbi:hypothetical protein ACFX13_026096 [Malus domestica]
MKLIGIMLAIYMQRLVRNICVLCFFQLPCIKVPCLKIYTISTQWYKISCGGLFTMFMNLFSHVGQQKN